MMARPRDAYRPKRHHAASFTIFSLCVVFLGAPFPAAAVVKVLSNSTHEASHIGNTVTQLLGSGHIDDDVIVHRTYLDNAFTALYSPVFGGTPIALDDTKTFYTTLGAVIEVNQAPYQLYTSSFTGYGGDTISVYNRFDGIDLAHNYASTVNAPGPPAFHIAPGSVFGSKGGVEWTISTSTEITFNSDNPSLSELTARNAGLLAAVRHDHPAWNWFDVKAAIRQTADNWNTGYDDTNYGFGYAYYASSTALTDGEILLQPPVATTTISSSGSGQINFTLYPYKQTRRVKEVLFQFDSDPGFQADELALGDITTTLGGTKITERTDTWATSTSTPIYAAFSNKYFVWFTADNADDNLANFSRVDTYSVLGPTSQEKIAFSSSFDLSSPADNISTTSSPMFSWDTAESNWGITKYQLFIDSALDTDNITATSTAPSAPLSDGAHTWYVKAFNGDGDATTTASTRTVNILSDYAPGYTFYVDNVAGNDSNPGRSATPWKTIAYANSVAQPGDTVVLVKNEGVPYRERIAPNVGNVDDGRVTFRGASAASKPEIWGSDNLSQSSAGGWTSYGGGNPNTYQKSVSVAVNVLAAGAGTSTLTVRTKGNNDSLNTGEFWYASGVLYYRLAGGEDINTLHIEVGQRGNGANCANYNTVSDIIIKYANSSGAYISVGCICNRLEIYDSLSGVYMVGFGSSESNPGPILKSSIISDNTSYGIYLQIPQYARVYNNVAYGNNIGMLVFTFAHNSIIKNNIFSNNTSYNVQFSGIPNTNFVASHNNWSFGAVDSSWSDTYQGTNNQASTSPLLVDATARDFRLGQYSPNIDSGINISGITSDILGNPIYGTPDIGPYEYQPPYTIGTHRINITGSTRLYADGKYRYTSATSTDSTADLVIVPQGGWGSGDYSEFMNISVSQWNTSGDYKKVWTETSGTAGGTDHTVGDLKAETPYIVKVDGIAYTDATTNDAGRLSFGYTGGYSTHTFTVEEAPAGGGIFTGPASALPGYVAPRLQMVYPDGTVVFLDEDELTATSTPIEDAEMSVAEISTVALDDLITEVVLPDTEVVATTTPPAVNALTSSQIDAVLSILISFGVDQYTYERVRDALVSTTVAPELTPPAQPQFSRYLVVGSYGSEVAALQQVLRELGYFTYPENTGYFGAITEDAVLAFQRDNGIEQVGVVGPKTRAALNAL